MKNYFSFFILIENAQFPPSLHQNGLPINCLHIGPLAVKKKTFITRLKLLSLRSNVDASCKHLRPDQFQTPLKMKNYLTLVQKI